MEYEKIEEMAKDRVAELRLFYNFCKYNGCEEKTAEDCERCYFNKVYFRLAELEGDIRKGKLKEIPEKAVVLTREEYDKLQSLKDDYTKGYEAGVDEGWDNARKETAEKFAERVKMAFYYEFDELIPSIMADKIDEICKEITEGKV